MQTDKTSKLGVIAFGKIKQLEKRIKEIEERLQFLEECQEETEVSKELI